MAYAKENIWIFLNISYSNQFLYLRIRYLNIRFPFTDSREEIAFISCIADSNML